jgi:hypothetical protein
MLELHSDATGRDTRQVQSWHCKHGDKIVTPDMTRDVNVQTRDDPFSTKLLNTYEQKTHNNCNHGDHICGRNDSQLVTFPHYTCCNSTSKSPNDCESKHRLGLGTVNATRMLPNPS